MQFLTAKQLASVNLEWPQECPAWISEYASRHQQAIQEWDKGVEGMGGQAPMRAAMMHDCSDEMQPLGCHCGIGDRMRAATETFKVKPQ